MTTPCFYKQPTCSDDLTREHVVSAGVLRIAFGDPIRNVAASDAFEGKRLIDHQAVVKDVCRVCNNERLGPYDAAGIDLAQQIAAVSDTTGLAMAINRWSLGWLLKTHLNFLRVFRDSETSTFYRVHDDIKQALIAQHSFPHHLVRIFIEGMCGEARFWDAENPDKLVWLHYRSVRFRDQRIVVSELRLKALSTLVFIPSDCEYGAFEGRVWSSIEEMERDFGFYLQPVNTRQAIEDGRLHVLRTLSAEEVKFRLHRSRLWTPEPVASLCVPLPHRQ